jgi:hypothetical protein
MRAAVDVRLRSTTIVQVFATIVAVLVLLHAAVLTARLAFGHDHLMGLAPAFSLHVEANIPTWYSAAALLACALALALIAAASRRQHARFVGHWIGLSLIFVYLSLDEVARVHEHWATVLEEPLAWMRTPRVFGGMFRNLWVIPGALVSLAVGLAYVPFLRHLPARTRTAFVVAGGCFVFAAVGFEMLGNVLTSLELRDLVSFWVVVTLEELLEMASILLFLHALLRYIAESIGPVQIRVDAP